jgi:hypothetical protein
MKKRRRLFALSQPSVLVALRVCERGDAQSVAGNWRPTGVVLVKHPIGNPATLTHATERQPVARNFVVLDNWGGSITTKASTSPPEKSKHHSKPLCKHGMQTNLLNILYGTKILLLF